MEIIDTKIFIFILLSILLFIIVYTFFYLEKKQIREGLVDTSEKNRFKLSNTRLITLSNVSDKSYDTVSQHQINIDNYLINATINPVANDNDLKNAINLIRDNIKNYSNPFEKLYFLASVGNTLFFPFLYMQNEMSRQYNFYIKCYPRTIQSEFDFTSIQIVVILCQLAKDITSSDLCPDHKHYYYIADPIISELNKHLDYFRNKLK